MCNFASFIVEKNYNVHWFPGVESHARILNLAEINDSSDFSSRDFVKVEVNPPNGGDRTKPVEDWKFVLDEDQAPSWWNDEYKITCLSALKDKLKRESEPYVVKDYYSNGQLGSEWNCVNGKQHGLSKEYYANGQLSFECNYVNDEKHGLCRNYHYNGQLRFEYNYVNGEKHGLCKEYYENGQLRLECNYVNGKAHGFLT